MKQKKKIVLSRRMFTILMTSRTDCLRHHNSTKSHYGFILQLHVMSSSFTTLKFSHYLPVLSL